MLNHAFVHHHDPMAQGHRFLLVVCDIDGRGSEHPLELRELDTHLHSELGIKVGEGFIEEEDLGVSHNRTSQSDSLTLPARQFLRKSVEQLLDPKHAGYIGDSLLNLCFRVFEVLQAE